MREPRTTLSGENIRPDSADARSADAVDISRRLFAFTALALPMAVSAKAVAASPSSAQTPTFRAEPLSQRRLR